MCVPTPAFLPSLPPRRQPQVMAAALECMRRLASKSALDDYRSAPWYARTSVRTAIDHLKQGTWSPPLLPRLSF